MLCLVWYGFDTKEFIAAKKTISQGSTDGAPLHVANMAGGGTSQATKTTREIGLAELFGLKGQRIIWGRLIMFLVANLVAQMVFVVQAIVTIPKGAQVSFPLEYWLSSLIVPVILCLALLIGLRWIASEWAGAAAAALCYTILMTSVRLLFYRGYHLSGNVINTFLWPLLTLIGFILALRLCRSLFQALLYSEILTGLLLSLLYQCIQLLIIRRPGMHFSLDLSSELLGIVSSALFALVFWSGLRLKWCQPQLLGSAPMVVSSAATAITDDRLQWEEKRSGQNRYCTQRGRSLWHATEILKAVGSIPGQTYYAVETPDGTLGRDTFGFYTEAPIKTNGLRLETSAPAPGPVDSVSLTAFGDAMMSQTAVAQLKSAGEYAVFVLLLECGHCGYKSPVETKAGDIERQCYACGAVNRTHRGTINVFVGSKMVQI
jgi:hypothetical protein